MSQKQKIIFGIIVFLAVFFRFYRISQMPGGLFPDMAANGLDINLMQQGHLQPFYERGNGREAMFFYFEWASVALFGKGVWQFSIVSALFGVLAVVMCYFATYRLFLTNLGNGFKPFPPGESHGRATHIALLAMFLMAVSSYHVVLSRTAFRATLIPFFSALTIYFLLRAFQSVTNKSKVWFAFLTGAAFALGFYTYIAFRIMVPIVAVIMLWPLLGQIKQGHFWRTVKKYFVPAAMFMTGFIIFIYPLAKYFYQHPGSFVGRAGQVSVFNPSLYLVDGRQLSGTPPLGVVVSAAGQVFKTQFLGFFTHGDLNWRQNISGYPFLSPLVSPFFGIGLLWMLALAVWYFFAPATRAQWWKYFLLIVWFFGMMLPVVTTAEGIPHGLRGIGVIPPMFIVAAWALHELWALILKFHRRLWSWHRPAGLELYKLKPFRYKFITAALKLVVVCFCLALITQSYFLYFVYAYNDPANFYYFRSDLTVVSQYLVRRCDHDRTYLILDKFSVQTTDYLTSDWHGNFSSPCNVPYVQVDPENSWQLSNLKSGDQIVFTQSSVFDTRKFKQYHPKARLKEEVRDKFGEAVMAVYEVNN